MNYPRIIWFASYGMTQDLLYYVLSNVVPRRLVDHGRLPDGLESLHTASNGAHECRSLVEVLIMRYMWVTYV